MAKPVAGINPRVLRWARERAGYPAGDVAQAIGKDEEVVKQWESGESAPTYAQLERLAYQLYKRPIALFFFPEPPQELDPAKEFRTLPDFEVERLASDTRFALRLAKAMQLALAELNDGKNPAEAKIFRDVRAAADTSARRLAELVRKYLGVSLKTQQDWTDTEDALLHWRSLIEERGVFVFKRSFKQREISGFCLVDPEFPVIYLNNGTAPARQSFTIFHELAHILLHTSGITKANDSFVANLGGPAKRVEVFANEFASEVLVPSGDFDRHLKNGPYDDLCLSNLAIRYRVSQEVILRKLLDRGLVNRKHYEERVSEWENQYRERRLESAGGNYYATQAAYLGDKFLQLAFSKYYQGRFGIEQLADYLNVKVRSIPGLEQLTLKRAAR